MRKCLLAFCLLSSLYVNAQEGERGVVDGERYSIYKRYQDKNVLIAQKVGFDGLLALMEYSSKKKLTPFIFEEIGGFFDKSTLSRVKVNGKWGVINTSGEMVIPCIYEVAVPTVLENIPYYIVRKNGRSGIINIKNEIVIPFEYEDITPQDALLEINRNGKYGLLQFPSGKMIIPAIYDHIQMTNDKLLLVKKGSLYTILNQSGEKAFLNWYSQLDIYYNEKFALVTLNGKKGLIDLTEKKLVPTEYEELEKIGGASKLSFIAARGGKYGIIDGDGKILLPFQYDVITSTNTNFLIASKDNKKGLLTRDGAVVIPFEYDEISQSQNGQYFTLSKDNKTGIADLSGKIIVHVEYESLRVFTIEHSYKHSGLVAVKNGKKGVIDLNENTRIDFIYDDLIKYENVVLSGNTEESFNSSIIAVKGGKYGVIDVNGREVLPFNYEDMQYLDRDLVIARKNNKYGIIDVNNKDNIVLPFEYRFVNFAYGDIIIAYKDSFEKYRVNGKKLLKATN